MVGIKIGIPRGLLYYKYEVMWRSFFEELGCEVIVSPNTNKAIMDMGTNHSIDESCTSAKVYMGHVEWLIGRCDYIFVPRIASYPDGDITCTKFHGIYDIVRATFPSAKLLHVNIDYAQKQTEWMAFKKLGTSLGGNLFEVRRAYKNALSKLEDYEKSLEKNQEKALNSDKLKVLIVAHPYNIYDKLIGEPIVKGLEDLGVEVIYADIPDGEAMCGYSKRLSKSMYWKYNKELIGSVEYYKDKIDGIVFLTTFPCGPDSLVVELLMRKLKGVPMTNLISDVNSGEAGLQTRIESFIDIIGARVGVRV